MALADATTTACDGSRSAAASASSSVAPEPVVASAVHAAPRTRGFGSSEDAATSVATDVEVQSCAIGVVRNARALGAVAAWNAAVRAASSSVTRGARGAVSA